MVTKLKVVIAGSTGFIGTHLEAAFNQRGYEVVTISRKPGSVSWSDRDGMRRALEGAHALINLAGRSVDCRYNEKNKKEILDSRVLTTQSLGETILRCDQPPKVWFNSSTATIYRHAEDRGMTESTGEIGSGFSVNVAKSWEQALFSFQLPNTRQAALRIAIVLGKGGGVMGPFVNLVRFGLGGKQGAGNQMFSWLHVDDLFEIILFLIQNEQLSGVINCSAPNPVTNAQLMRSIQQMMGMPLALPTPKLLLEFGAILIRTETELILKSRWVLPERLLAAGYQFRYPTLDMALTQILK